jgi:hypothetical protein
MRMKIVRVKLPKVCGALVEVVAKIRPDAIRVEDHEAFDILPPEWPFPYWPEQTVEKIRRAGFDASVVDVGTDGGPA